VAQKVGRGIALLFHDRGARRGRVVSSMPRPHFNPGKDPVPIVQEAGWDPVPVWIGVKNLAPHIYIYKTLKSLHWDMFRHDSVIFREHIHNLKPFIVK